VSGKATAFTYDGLGRRTAIASTPPGGGSAVTTSFLWCESDICQARNAGNLVIRSYYDEGEFVPGAPAQPYYYGVDQIGSVRRTFASTSSAPAYGYDPYGVPLQATAPLTDFVYGGMFYNADSGLYLTRYRAYDPVAGRWLSRDPMGEMTDASANLYPYVGGNPVRLTDPDGRMIWPLPWPRRPSSSNACPKPPSPPGCPPGMSCMTEGGSSEDSSVNKPEVPPLPEGLVGTQDEKAGPARRRHNSGPLDPSHGGTGDATKDFDILTGGQNEPAGDRFPPGTLIGPNDITLRPGSGDAGPRIDIPGNGSKPHETLHY